MVNPDLVKKGLIDFLRADTDLINALSVYGHTGTIQIRETQFQSQDISYPSIVIDVQPQTPIGDGIDRLKLSTLNWIVRVFSEDKSSHEANNLLNLVMQAQFNKQFTGNNLSNLPNFRVIRVDLINIEDAYRLSERLWMASATFESQVNLINP